MQIISILLVMLVTVGVIFRKQITEEYKIITRKDVLASKENLVASFFVPFSWKERTKLLQEHLQLLNAVQSKLPKTLLAKHFVDYKDEIEKEERRIRERIDAENELSDLLSFSTPNLFQIYASRAFKDEELIEFGDILDTHVDDSLFEIIHVNVDHVHETVVINMNCTCQQLDGVEEKPFQEFVLNLSQTLFNGKQINLQVDIDKDEETKTLHFSSMKKNLP